MRRVRDSVAEVLDGQTLADAAAGKVDPLGGVALAS
jgi:DNA-binding IscR family transcriptional regulator